jgi:ABC-type Fe3+ transport system permease subunit
MGSVVCAGVLVIAFGVMSFLFARNAYTGFQSGTVLARSEKYRRDKQPIYFWIALGTSVSMAVLCSIVTFGAIVLCAVVVLRQ